MNEKRLEKQVSIAWLSRSEVVTLLLQSLPYLRMAQSLFRTLWRGKEQGGRSFPASFALWCSYLQRADPTTSDVRMMVMRAIATNALWQLVQELPQGRSTPDFRYRMPFARGRWHVQRPGLRAMMRSRSGEWVNLFLLEF